MPVTSLKRYVFGGHAVATEAHIRTPQDHICWIQGAMALPATGGYGKIEVPGQKCPIPGRGSSISFDSAAAFVSGDFVNGGDPDAADDPDSPTRVVTAAYVTGLNVLDRLRVKSVSAHLVADDPRDGQPRVQFGETNPITRDSEQDPIVGLTIDGFPLLIEFNSIFRALCTLEEVQDEFGDEGNPYVTASVVQSLRFADGQPKDATIEDNVITIANFARIYVGELLIEERSRRLTLLRLQLDPSGRDNDSFGDVGSDPRGWPPT
jgi:hypothetical protein